MHTLHSEDFFIEPSVFMIYRYSSSMRNSKTNKSLNVLFVTAALKDAD